jgi:hypothetical protein
MIRPYTNLAIRGWIPFIAAALLVLAFPGACGNQSGNNISGNQGSVRIANGHPPSRKTGEITFSGAIDGTSQATHESCEGGGRVFRHFTVMATGEIGGRQYFLSASVYPYQGSGTYQLRALPHVPLDYVSPPNPLIDEAPGGYPGFLNLIPKSDPGNAYAGVPSGALVSAMAVDAGEQTGWFDIRMTSVNQKASAPARLRVAGQFACGQPFSI